ncbi:hypothetical protein CFAM422_004823 [Trichoderma lentiforme]|uniref:Uncharacterized protein n=1 Tax=Trichoderma lentiforme TaxID=1567552 RepID=A0A9P5CCR3_9HYPO|nr:hypothetical protein CFAM422_004823 [Trichoderma lentiforme]
MAKIQPLKVNAQAATWPWILRWLTAGSFQRSTEQEFGILVCRLPQTSIIFWINAAQPIIPHGYHSRVESQLARAKDE